MPLYSGHLGTVKHLLCGVDFDLTSFVKNSKNPMQFLIDKEGVILYMISAHLANADWFNMSKSVAPHHVAMSQWRGAVN